jgi:hypothetical protein
VIPLFSSALSFPTWCECAKFRTLASPTSSIFFCAFLPYMVRVCQIQNTRIPNLHHLTNLSITWLSMPRTILVRPPGGATGRVRRWYAVRQKLQLLEECNRLRRVENLSLRGAAAAMSNPHTILVRWTKARPRLIA